MIVGNTCHNGLKNRDAQILHVLQEQAGVAVVGDGQIVPRVVDGVRALRCKHRRSVFNKIHDHDFRIDKTMSNVSWAVE